MRKLVRFTTVSMGWLLLLAGRPAHAQDGMVGATFLTGTRWTVGYAVNAPSQLVGFSTMVIGRRFAGWGVYADYKLALDPPSDRPEYDASLSVDQAVNQFNDRFVGDESAWTTLNLAIVRALTGTLAVYVGGGYSKEKAYRQFFDAGQTRGQYGFYWVDDDDSSGTRVNLLAGVWFRLTESVMVQFGGESAPRGFTVGASLAVPVVR